MNKSRETLSGLNRCCFWKKIAGHIFWAKLTFSQVIGAGFQRIIATAGRAHGWAGTRTAGIATADWLWLTDAAACLFVWSFSCRCIHDQLAPRARPVSCLPPTVSENRSPLHCRPWSGGRSRGQRVGSRRRGGGARTRAAAALFCRRPKPPNTAASAAAPLVF